MSYANLRLDIADGLATITLDRPEVLNAFNFAMVVEFQAALNEVGCSGARALLLTGAGRAFSAGPDLTDPAVRSATILDGHFNPLIEAIFALPLPVVAAVNGAAVGVGCSIALAADIVFAGRSAYFLQSFVHVGLVPDGGSTWLLPRLIGKARAQAMMMLGTRVPADTAENWGMIHQCLDDAKLASTARATAIQLAGGPTRSYALIRSGIRRALDGDLASTLAMEAENQREAATTADHAEALAAFLDRRTTSFEGR